MSGSDRGTIVAANWKMNGSRALIESTVKTLASGTWCPSTKVVVAPPATCIPLLQAALSSDARVIIAAQNIHQEPKGAYTGEISTELLLDIGVTWV
jgi:triosephosphate isomerase